MDSGRWWISLHLCTEDKHITTNVITAHAQCLNHKQQLACWHFYSIEVVQAHSQKKTLPCLHSYSLPRSSICLPGEQLRYCKAPTGTTIRLIFQEILALIHANTYLHANIQACTLHTSNHSHLLAFEALKYLVSVYMHALLLFVIFRDKSYWEYKYCIHSFIFCFVFGWRLWCWTNCLLWTSTVFCTNFQVLTFLGSVKTKV